MMLPDLYESSRSRAARAHRRGLVPKIMDAVRKAGAEVAVMDKTTLHYRLTLSTGFQLEFWPTTLKWGPSRGTGPAGDGFRGLLEVIENPPPQTPPAESARAQGGLTNVFADASFDHRLNKGGWGAVIKGDSHDWIEVSGPLEDCPTSMEAELRALANGLQVAIKRGVVVNDSIVLLQSDCLAALAIILGGVPGCRASQGPSDIELPVPRRPSKGVQNSLAIAHIKTLVAGRSIRLLVRHNRGHAGGNNGRSIISNRADRLAGKQLQKLRRARKEHA